MSEIFSPHSWNLNPREARALQEQLRKELIIQPINKEIQYIGGADISFNKYEKTVYAGIIILDIQSLKAVAHGLAITEVHFPYIPGLLSFREIPALLEAWNILELKPDVMMIDGHGLAHPRRMGIASHFGLLTHSPSLGVAKKKLVGHYTEPTAQAGNFTPLEHEGETIGYVYRTKKNVKPVFVSPGHLLDLDNALHFCQQCTGRYRIPEPTRQAHILVNKLRRSELSPGFFQYTDSS